MPKPAFIEILLWRSVIILFLIYFFSRADHPLKDLFICARRLVMLSWSAQSWGSHELTRSKMNASECMCSAQLGYESLHWYLWLPQVTCWSPIASCQCEAAGNVALTSPGSHWHFPPELQTWILPLYECWARQHVMLKGICSMLVSGSRVQPCVKYWLNPKIIIFPILGGIDFIIFYWSLASQRACSCTLAYVALLPGFSPALHVNRAG